MFKFKLVRIIGDMKSNYFFDGKDVERFLEDWEEVSKSDKELLEYVSIYGAFNLNKKSLYIIEKEYSEDVFIFKDLKKIISEMRAKEEKKKHRLIKSQQTRAKNRLEKARKILLENGLPVE